MTPRKILLIATLGLSLSIFAIVFFLSGVLTQAICEALGQFTSVAVLLLLSFVLLTFLELSGRFGKRLSEIWNVMASIALAGVTVLSIYIWLGLHQITVEEKILICSNMGIGAWMGFLGLFSLIGFFLWQMAKKRHAAMWSIGLIVGLVVAVAGLAFGTVTQSGFDLRINRLYEKEARLIEEYSRDRDYLKSPNWKEECLASEREFETLIGEYLIKEGAQSRTAAKLRSHLAVLYSLSGRGDSHSLAQASCSVLFPSCPSCHKNDAIGLLSPPPFATIEDLLKDGWWFCRRCDSENHPFQATREEAR